MHREEAENVEVVRFYLVDNVTTSQSPWCAIFLKRVKNKIYCLSSERDKYIVVILQWRVKITVHAYDLWSARIEFKFSSIAY